MSGEESWGAVCVLVYPKGVQKLSSSFMRHTDFFHDLDEMHYK